MKSCNELNEEEKEQRWDEGMDNMKGQLKPEGGFYTNEEVEQMKKDIDDYQKSIGNNDYKKQG